MAGESFLADGYRLSRELKRAWGPRLARLAVGLVHIASAFIWFGTIFYVHLMIGPRSLSSGLPKAEMRLGRLAVAATGLSGLALTLWRIKGLEELWTTTFGLVWLVKVGLFAVMVLIAVVTTTTVNRRLGQGPGEGWNGTAPADGREGRPAHLKVEEVWYDVSQSPLWPEGLHMARHRAGQDLTAELAGAPHGPEVLAKLPRLDPVPESRPRAERPVVGLFRALVVAATVCAGLILLCLAYWRWGPPLV